MAHVGRYSKVIRELEEVIQTLVTQADRALAEQDAEIERLRSALELIAGSASNELQMMHAKNALDNIGAKV